MERTLPADLPSISRNDDRHSHIGIRLQYRTDDKWEYLEALEWNAVGFNFYHAQAMQGPELQLPRGLNNLWNKGGIMYAFPVR